MIPYRLSHAFPIIGIIYDICGLMNQIPVLRQLRLRSDESNIRAETAAWNTWQIVRGKAPVLQNKEEKSFILLNARTIVGATILLHVEQAFSQILYESLARSLGSIHRFVFLEL